MSVKILLTWALSLVRGCFFAGIAGGTKVWTSYFLNSASFHSPLCIMRSVTSVTWGFRSSPERAALAPASVSSIVLSVTIFSTIIPWRPLRSFTMALSASASGTGPSDSPFRKSSSGMSLDSAERPLSVRRRTFASSSLTMSASPFLLSHPTAILSAPPGMTPASASMEMLPPAASIALTAVLSGSSPTSAGSAKNLSDLSVSTARPLDSSQEAAPMASTSREKLPSETRSAPRAFPPLPSNASRSLFSL